ncbi:hypothetical protein EJ04DRAFT_581803 [Polyplosphaeria fusca]|uniref:F-box domain-containing protein n=1 Tax=Polyplosphaeria fusca TaxID=682080 RepID=A0A9P4UWG2_9PLEO|nr:hypothetical protein EJ04DRAFT_581803 [Polyplosphaeria fusca]
MDHLPPEIQSQIVSVLADDTTIPIRRRLARYSTVSHHFRAAVEERTFRNLTLTTHDLPWFRYLFGGANLRRRGYLRQILFRFELPNEAPNPCCDTGRVVDRNADSSSFTESVKMLFSILNDLRNNCPRSPPPLYLRFVNATRKTDLPNWQYGRRKLKEGDHNKRDPILAEIQRGWYDMLPAAAEKLPAIGDVTEFDFGCGDQLRDLGRQWIGLVLGKMPHLETLTLDVWDNIEWGRKIRRRLRKDLETSLLNLPFTHLKHFNLGIYSNRVKDESLNPPSLIHDRNDNTDGDMSSITLLSHLSTLPHLTNLYLDGPLLITPGIFSSLTPNAFPALKYFHLDFAPETADGRWFFERDHGFVEEDADMDSVWETPDEEYYDYEMELDMKKEPKPLHHSSKDPDYEGPVSQSRCHMNHYRILPTNATVAPLLLAAAETAKNACSLRKFVMRACDGLSYDYTEFVKPSMKRPFLIMLLRPDEICSDMRIKLGFDEEHYRQQNRMWWRVGDRWRPEGDVIKAWKAAVGYGGTVGFLMEYQIKTTRYDDMFKTTKYDDMFIGDPELV